MKANHEASHPQDWLEILRSQLASLKFGVIQMTIHEGNVVQIDRTEKFRLERTVPRVTTGGGL